MKCARCGEEIPKGQQMTEKICGRYVPVHRDCDNPYETNSLETMMKKVRKDFANKRRAIEKRRRK